MKRSAITTDTVQRRCNHVVHQLGAGGRVQERFGGGADAGGRVEQQLADPLSGGRAARLAYSHHLASFQLERIGKHRGLGGLAAAVEALERDEHREGCYRSATTMDRRRRDEIPT
jgi:hypothetical protein